MNSKNTNAGGGWRRPSSFVPLRGDQRKGQKPWIFVPRKEDYFEAMKPLMALWLECAASAVLGLMPSPSRRLWFVLDELADLPRVANLTCLLPEGRKFGASISVTFQTIGQMRDRYGREGAEALLGCCNTKLFLQLVDQASRDWASETIGSTEVENLARVIPQHPVKRDAARPRLLEINRFAGADAKFLPVNDGF